MSSEPGSAIPMLRRCFLNQWRGLSPAEQCKLNEVWTRRELPTAGWVKVPGVAQVERPIWAIIYPNSSRSMLTLMSVKDEFFGDVPA